MRNEFNLTRYLEAQSTNYDLALTEIRNGKKRSHWIWYIFPQIKGLGFSNYNIYYGIASILEAQAYYDHPILGKRLIEITEAFLKIQDKTAIEILGSPDERKMRSCMTLFSTLNNASPCFNLVIHKFYKNIKDKKTLAILFENNYQR